MFLLHCLLTDSPPDRPEEIAAIARNKRRVAARGREPGLRLVRDGHELELREWAGKLLAECVPIAKSLDAACRGDAYEQALAAAAHCLDNPASLPSARVLSEIEQRYDGSYFRFALAYSLRHRGTLQDEPLPADVEARYADMAEASLEKQRLIEARDQRYCE